MDEVLEKMYEDTSTAISRDEKELFISRIKRGQIYDHNKDHNKAVELWKGVLEEVVSRVKFKQTEVSDLKISADSEAESENSVTSDDEDVEDERRAKRRQYLRTKRANELRDLLDLQHRATFMMASANFQLKNEVEETRLYEEAEALRQKVPQSCVLSDRQDSSTSYQTRKSLYQAAERYGGCSTICGNTGISPIAIFRWNSYSQSFREAATSY
jgi:hypothetical protein